MLKNDARQTDEERHSSNDLSTGRRTMNQVHLRRMQLMR